MNSSGTVLDVTTIEPKYKHKEIFTILNSLNKGEFLEIINDHDPKPLYYTLQAERSGEFSWEYKECGPQIWKVIITRN